MVAISLLVQASNKEIVPWREDFAAAKIEAATQHKPMLLYFTAVWCSPCDYMKHTTFASNSVNNALAGYVPVKIDIDQNKALAEQFGAPPIPLFYVIDTAGRPIKTISGAMEPEEFVNWLNGK